MDDAPALLLPLEVAASGGARVARFPGGNHANGNFPWLAREWAEAVDRAALDGLVAAIRRARPDVAALSLTRQRAALGGLANPLLLLGKALNPNPALAVSLGGGFEAALAHGNAKRKLKKHRQHGRRYEEAGGWRVTGPETPEQSDAMLDVFFHIKAQRFRTLGIDDPFADAGVQAFFRACFGPDAGRAAPEFELRALEVGGEIRSVIGKVFSPEGPTVEFGAIREDALASASPGEFLFFEDIARSCDQGHAVYSFGIGDEPYKREWCDREEALYDTALPLSARGRLFVGLHGARNALAGAVKRNPRLWRLAKGLRRRLSRR